MTRTVQFVLGTRPEIIKLSPVIRECDRRGVEFTILHTGQHYSEELDEIFFTDLGLPAPDDNLGVGSKPQGRQTGEMIAGIEEILTRDEPDVVLVQGDTNSVLAGAIAVSKLPDIELGHVEAGLRSFDREMPEEINRRLTDHVSEYLFAPTEEASRNLTNEGLSPDRITVTGNTIVDAVQDHMQVARDERDLRERFDLGNRFGLLTAHRQENVDDSERFQSLLDGVGQAADAHEMPVLYPIHPRARQRIEEYDLDVPSRISVVEPLDFLDFLAAEDEATVVFTDSGGVQEETCILGTPCVTLRDNTERPETVEVGSNRVVGVEPESIQAGVAEMLDVETSWENPFGDGAAAERILDVIEANL
jgi:UDP-N-acetylglucosamine 2-epimerase (non-hydrolysing)